MRYNLFGLRRNPYPSSPMQRPLLGISVEGISSFGRGVMRGVMRYANMHHQWLIYKDLRRTLLSGRDWPRCDGAVVAGVGRSDLEKILGNTRHVVQCAGSADPEESLVVCLDDLATGAMAAEHLMECQIRNFGFFGIARGSASEKRCRGFMEALAKRGFTCDVCPVLWPSEVEWTNNEHWPHLISWLESLPKPVGILAVDDQSAHDLASACVKAHISVPDHVAIIGVNNDDLMCESAWPPLSSVETDFSRMGFAAAVLLDRLFHGEKVAKADRLVRLPPLGVQRRMSTDMLAVDEPNVLEAIRFIRENACNPCDVKDVLQQVPVGRRWLERQFQAKLGRSPHDEIMRVRMEAAKRLLLQPTLSLEQIAEKCGFSATPNFGRAFRQTQGISPAVYRRDLTRL